MPRNTKHNRKGTKHNRILHRLTSAKLFGRFKESSLSKQLDVLYWLKYGKNFKECMFKEHLKNATKETLNILVKKIEKYYQYPKEESDHIFNKDPIMKEYEKLTFIQKQAFWSAIDQIESSFSKKLSDFQIKLDDEDKESLNNLVELYNKEEDINIKILLVLADAINSNFRI
jgi:hypothetical protein